MHDLVRIAWALRCDLSDPAQTFRHRVGVGLVVATLILIFSFLG